jgi:hypothetical protein
MTEAHSELQALTHALLTIASDGARQWLQGLLDSTALDENRIGNAYAAAKRHFGEDAPRARTLLLLLACERLAADAHARLVRDLFRRGDNDERIALLRSLHHLPQSERFVETAIEACRSHVQDVFEAIACDNPYPAASFPDLNFQQLVMKALFTGAPLSRVIGYQTRITDELKRMVTDYAAERTAAGRVVPDDVALILQGVAP